MGAIVPDDRSQPVRFSVVVPVYNRARELRRLLESLGRQTFPHDRFEILVCDDGSHDEPDRVVQMTATRYDLRVTCLHQENRGPGHARNLGLVHARGEIVAFTDSDCEPAPGWLAALDRAFQDRTVGLVGGAVDYRDARYLSGRCVNFLMSSTLGAGGARDPRVPLAMRFYPRTGNLAVRRDLALAANGFPGVAYGEDLEFSHRVCALGVSPLFVPEAVVLHNERSSPVRAFSENLQKGAARYRLRRSCRMHQPIHLLPAALVLYLLTVPLAAAILPHAVPLLALPLILYALALVVLAVRGAVAIADPRGLVAVPLYALMMHLGYGLGYLAGAAGVIGTCTAEVSPDRAELLSAR